MDGWLTFAELTICDSLAPLCSLKTNISISFDNPLAELPSPIPSPMKQCLCPPLGFSINGVCEGGGAGEVVGRGFRLQNARTIFRLETLFTTALDISTLFPLVKVHCGSQRSQICHCLDTEVTDAAFQFAGIFQ